MFVTKLIDFCVKHHSLMAEIPGENTHRKMIQHIFTFPVCRCVLFSCHNNFFAFQLLFLLLLSLSLHFYFYFHFHFCFTFIFTFTFASLLFFTFTFHFCRCVLFSCLNVCGFMHWWGLTIDITSMNVIIIR